jgi:hypothetical protein
LPGDRRGTPFAVASQPSEGPSSDRAAKCEAAAWRGPSAGAAACELMLADWARGARGPPCRSHCLPSGTMLFRTSLLPPHRDCSAPAARRNGGRGSTPPNKLPLGTPLERPFMATGPPRRAHSARARLNPLPAPRPPNEARREAPRAAGCGLRTRRHSVCGALGRFHVRASLCNTLSFLRICMCKQRAPHRPRVYGPRCIADNADSMGLAGCEPGLGLWLARP